MSKEYEQAGEHSWCTDYAYRVMETAKGPDSLSMLKALLMVEGSVAHEAFIRLGLDPIPLRKELQARKKELGDALDEETWIVDKATRRSKADGFTLATDYILEVIWDEECEGSRWLADRISAEGLEEALNASRYPEDGEEPGLDVPWARGPAPVGGAAAAALPEGPPRSH